MADWDKRFVDLAFHVSGWSKDRSTGVGCVIVGPNNEIRAMGYNGFPRGIDDDKPERHERPIKYKWTEHAERNAIYNAARCGTQLDGCRMFTQLYPCSDCARGIIQSGIVEVVTIEPDWEHDRWGDDFRLVRTMFGEVKMTCRFIKGPSVLGS